MSNQKVCIIGAGSSGIVAAKVLHERGVPFDCLERGSGIGGNWRYLNDNGMSSSYRSLHINTSRDKMQYSDYPMPRHYPEFPHHSQILEYFESYVDHFGFRDKIAFGTTVESVQQAEGGFQVNTTRNSLSTSDLSMETGQQHSLPTSDLSVETGQQHSQYTSNTYTSVLVANGHHWQPRWPDFPGHFDGQVMHSHDYKTPEGYEGKKVLVVGIGNSACDIACELSRVADSVYLSTRSGAHVIPKYILGKPLDKIAPPWFWRYLPKRLFNSFFEIMLRVSRGRLSRFGLPTPKHRILEEHPTISSDLLNLIGHGKVHVRPNIEHLAGDRVQYAGGGEEAVDCIIYATGYKIAFPFLDDSIINPEGNEVALYKHVAHTELANLYFIGLIQPWGAIMPLAEQQSEWIADLLEGKAALPSHDSMVQDIQRTRDKMRRRYRQSERHTIQVDYYPYLDALKKERKLGRKRCKSNMAPQAVSLSPETTASSSTRKAA